MRSDQPTQRDVVPEDFGSLEEFWGFWDTQSTADYEELMEPVEVEIELSSGKMCCTVARE